MPSSKLQLSIEDRLHAWSKKLSERSLLIKVKMLTRSGFIPPRKEELDKLARITHDPEVSIPKLAEWLRFRARSSDWSATLKTLITIHHLISFGNERFIQNLASSNSNGRPFIDMENHAETLDSQNIAKMMNYAHRFARYINVKIVTYRTLGLDFCRFRDGSSRSLSRMRHMPFNEISSTLPFLKRELEALLEFDVCGRDMSLPHINVIFLVLYNDFVRLYISYQAAIVRLLELFSTISSKPKRVAELLAHYKEFFVMMDRVSDYMRIIDATGIDKSDLPNLSRVPNSLSVKALEEHLENLERESSNRKSIQAGGQASSSIYDPATTLTPIVQPPKIELQYESSSSQALRKPNRRQFKSSNDNAELNSFLFQDDQLNGAQSTQNSNQRLHSQQQQQQPQSQQAQDDNLPEIDLMILSDSDDDGEASEEQAGRVSSSAESANCQRASSSQLKTFGAVSPSSSPLQSISPISQAGIRDISPAGGAPSSSCQSKSPSESSSGVPNGWVQVDL